jgi:hypothetical protein
VSPETKIAAMMMVRLYKAFEKRYKHDEYPGNSEEWITREGPSKARPYGH